MQRASATNVREPLPELSRTVLFASPLLELADVHCRGTCRHRSPEECTHAAQLILPYRGTFLRHLGRRALLADANQVLFFGAGQPHQVSHPVAGGDASLVLTLAPATLAELASTGGVDAQGERFRREQRTLAPAALMRRARIATRLARGDADALEAETTLLELARDALSPTAPPRRRPTAATRQLVERARLRLAEADGVRLSLAQIAQVAGASPVYLTQVFRDLEGVPLYRYQGQLRLAQALARLPDADDLATLALDLGFASHSQFATRFRAAFGVPPSRWREALNKRKAATARG
jgi:AraC-like DNA-binding protein